MLTTVLTAFYLIMPLIIAGTLHMLLVRVNGLAFLAKPLHAETFGQNKTWRGLLMMPVFAIFGVWFTTHLFPADWPLEIHIAQQYPYLLGACLGLGYALFELPNSFIKRRLGVAPGKLPEKGRGLFFVLDHTDSLVGCLAVYTSFFNLSGLTLLTAVVLAPLIHTLINLLLWGIGLRKEKF